ncbi:MAG: Stp1/IreP family PP2C-type Ser/Thr phosphatase [Bdellovibrionales bacterium]|nr:Stp1/IreP family PP2C-type Ser/Thr phosphatase [Bdellovibrionales bacterium]
MATVESRNDTPERRFKFDDAVLSDVGRRRNENQDAYAVAHTDQVSLYLVADGMGGARGGATASSIAVNVISDGAFTHAGEINAESLKAAIERANRVIFNRSKNDEELSGMGTTVVAVAIVSDQLLLAHVGDSRIYRLRDSSIEQLTRDHTLVQELVDTGAIPPEEAANHPIAHMLTRSLGPTEAVEVEVQSVARGVASGDRFVLCSDGLYNLVAQEEIAQALAHDDPQAAARKLVDLALERGGTDNVTVEVVYALDINDESLNVAYPVNGSRDVTMSEQSRVDGLAEMIQAAIVEEGGEAQVGEQAAEHGAQAEPYHPKADPYAATQRLMAITEAQLEEEDDAIPLPEIEDDVEPKHTSPSEAASERVEIADVNAHQELKRIMYGSAVLVLLVLVGVGYVFIRNGSHASTDVQATLDERQQLEAELVEPSTQVASTTTEVVEERLEEATPSPGTAEDTPSNETPLDDAQEGTADSEGAAVAEAREPDSAPEASTMTAAEIEQFVLSGDDPFPQALPPGISELTAELISELEVPPPPEVKIADEAEQSAPATQPIVWENEAAKLARIQNEDQQAVETPHVEESPAPSAAPVLAGDEVGDKVTRKQQIRGRIADLDAKLRLLSLNSPEDVQARAQSLKQELAAADREVEQMRSELDTAHNLFQKWLDFKNQAATTPRLRLADAVADYSDELRDKRDAYAEASRRYLEAVDAWQEKPDELTTASRMGALGRVLQKRRTELEEGVTVAIAEGIERVVARIGEVDVALRNLMLRREMISRHLGYHQGFVPLSGERRRALKQTYLDDRKTLVDDLESLKRQVPDLKEIEWLQLQSTARFPLPAEQARISEQP